MTLCHYYSFSYSLLKLLHSFWLSFIYKNFFIYFVSSLNLEHGIKTTIVSNSLIVLKCIVSRSGTFKQLYLDLNV